MRTKLFTIGHSTRSAEVLIELLQAHGITGLADVRTIPRSRHNPQFNGETFARTLADAGIAYRHMKSLGGLRKTRKDSINQGWKNASFRGYADYMQTDEFTEALDDLLDWAHESPVAVMCAEAVPWRCHRSLIADAATVRGVEVFHIFGGERVQAHGMTSFAKVDGERITYPFALAQKS